MLKVAYYTNFGVTNSHPNVVTTVQVPQMCPDFLVHFCPGGGSFVQNFLSKPTNVKVASIFTSLQDFSGKLLWTKTILYPLFQLTNKGRPSLILHNNILWCMCQKSNKQFVLMLFLSLFFFKSLNDYKGEM